MAASCSLVSHTGAMFVECLWKRLLLLCVLLVLTSEATVETVSDQPKPVCTVKGRVYTELKWYGYLVQKPLMRKWAKIQYQITYPVSECCTDLLIYYDDQIRELKEAMTCQERVNILPANNHQVIPLYKNNRTVGCNVWNETGEPYYVCLGERVFRSSGVRTWYFALSRCDARKSLNLNYVFNISGYYGDCEADPLSKVLTAPAPVSDRFWVVAVALGVVAGIALILASVFLALWLLSRRRTGSKGSSVTSSQATMTQDDVFYVNPSLSDREQTDYSQSSSENYYEVIPERRSYESINAHLTVPGHGHSSRHAHATLLKEMRPFATTFVFDDYPPPPYQPPRGMPKHHTLQHPQHGQHQLVHPQAHAHAHAHMHAHGPHSLPLQHQHPLQQRERPLQTHTETTA
ncbi:uncharacterized protein LOC121373332 [Gigantopelta aegis]|uniref:uncharacterized protein LOC121373332 n=1 Tax=Gigantopelta aegis TaxID=1735272 RepID=UPI001B88AEAE|nr:uncharacterized protein LOC121373332 [Gigantopelta aegis]XP_041355837.1 uncharacterized protein LOC121373332 [Gigantopelta aegis]XP_041355838.1 uncharacterized protein LOC121373332 [Gigantopelta aegis]XP_041355839.1 uncharacterized protein LOC121373332 [Gigantopelta aegis]XP_041355840.1 uncharacterized protein LOC121373332 [Gigantopelta aegis]